MASSFLVWRLLALIWLPKLSMWCTDAFWGMFHIWHVSVLDQFLTPIEFVLRCSRSINLWNRRTKFELCIDTSPSTWHSTPGWLDLIGTNQVFAFKPFFATRADTSEWPWGPTMIMWFLFLHYCHCFWNAETLYPGAFQALGCWHQDWFCAGHH